MIRYKDIKIIDNDQLEKLYNDVQWTAYTKDMALLHEAFSNSLKVVSAWDGDRLIGLIRLVGDGLTIIYIQDLLVLEDYQNQGIATQLMQKIMEDYKEVRQKVLLTEEEPGVRHFYEKNGFQSCDKGSLVAFANLN